MARAKLNKQAKRILGEIQTQIQKLFRYNSQKDILDYVFEYSGKPFVRDRWGEAGVEPGPLSFGVSDAPYLHLSKGLIKQLNSGKISRRRRASLREEITHFEDQVDQLPNLFPVYSFREQVAEEFLADLSRIILADICEGNDDDFVDEAFAYDLSRYERRVYTWADKYASALLELHDKIGDEQFLKELRALAHRHGKERLAYAKELIYTYSKN